MNFEERRREVALERTELLAEVSRLTREIVQAERKLSEPGELTPLTKKRRIAADRQALLELSAAAESMRTEEDRLSEILLGIEQSRLARKEDQFAFWYQRLNTSLAIAHGAGFAAVAAHLFDPSTTPQSAGLGLPALAVFGVGTIVAGSIPLALLVENPSAPRRITPILSSLAAVLFCAAILASLWGATLKSQDRIWSWQIYSGASITTHPAPSAS